jgi:hypothetical protein
VIGHFFSRGEGEVDLARLSPSVNRAESDWRATVIPGCPRCSYIIAWRSIIPPRL